MGRTGFFTYRPGKTVRAFGSRGGQTSGRKNRETFKLSGSYKARTNPHDLSHHGTKNGGSPQPPKTINAFALHHVDYLSSELNHFQGLLDGASASASGLWTAMDWKLGRSVFRGFLTCDNAAAAREGED